MANLELEPLKKSKDARQALLLGFPEVDQAVPAYFSDHEGRDRGKGIVGG